MVLCCCLLPNLNCCSHTPVVLLYRFLSGLVGMMEKSGGMMGFTRSIAKYAKTSRAGQAATFFVGLMVFFDDYANSLLAGKTMMPLTDMLFVSREKLAFIVDATGTYDQGWVLSVWASWWCVSLLTPCNYLLFHKLQLHLLRPCHPFRVGWDLKLVSSMMKLLVSRVFMEKI